jgi:hypothetical protein
MSSERQLSHDILNALERLRIMHDLLKEKNFKSISKDELTQDLKVTLQKLEVDFEKLAQ